MRRLVPNTLHVNCWTLCGLLIWLAAPALGENPSLDKTFHSNGILTFANASFSNAALRSVVTADSTGTLLVGGRTFNGNGSTNQSAILFGRVGTAGTDLTQFSFQPRVCNRNCHAIAFDGTNAVLVGASETDCAGYLRFTVVRTTTTGVEDTTFDTQTVSALELPTGGVAIARATIFDAARNRIYLVGYAFEYPANPGHEYYNPMIACINSTTGTLDGSFGVGGWFRLPYSTDAGFLAAAMQQQPQTGNLFLVGNFTNTDGNTHSFIACVTPAGKLASSFNGNGQKTINLSTGGGPDTLNGACFHADGTLLACGTVGSGSQTSFTVAKISANGQLDSTFNPNGVIPGAVSFSPGTNNAGATSVTVSGSAILVCGSATNPATNTVQMVVAKLLADGTFVNTFGTSGIAFVRVGDNGDIPQAIASQTISGEQKIVLVGRSTQSNGTTQACICRLVDSPNEQAAIKWSIADVKPQIDLENEEATVSFHRSNPSPGFVEVSVKYAKPEFDRTRIEAITSGNDVLGSMWFFPVVMPPQQVVVRLLDSDKNEKAKKVVMLK